MLRCRDAEMLRCRDAEMQRCRSRQTIDIFIDTGQLSPIYYINIYIIPGSRDSTSGNGFSSPTHHSNHRPDVSGLQDFTESLLVFVRYLATLVIYSIFLYQTFSIDILQNYIFIKPTKLLCINM